MSGGGGAIFGGGILFFVEFIILSHGGKKLGKSYLSFGSSVT